MSATICRVCKETYPDPGHVCQPDTAAEYGAMEKDLLAAHKDISALSDQLTKAEAALLEVECAIRFRADSYEALIIIEAWRSTLTKPSAGTNQGAE